MTKAEKRAREVKRQKKNYRRKKQIEYFKYLSPYKVDLRERVRGIF